jgi:hypothetical protein
LAWERKGERTLIRFGEMRGEVWEGRGEAPERPGPGRKRKWRLVGFLKRGRLRQGPMPEMREGYGEGRGRLETGSGEIGRAAWGRGGGWRREASWHVRRLEGVRVVKTA